MTQLATPPIATPAIATPAIVKAPFIGVDTTREFVPLRIGVVTVSDTRQLADDKSGNTLEERLTKAGHVCVGRKIVTDDKALIAQTVLALIAQEGAQKPDVMITTGGTGFTGRDVTPDALEPLFVRRMDGFAALFHRLSFETIGTSTIQSRATAGVIGDCFVFVLPGSPGACRDAWDGILSQQLDSRYRPCNFVEIIPRLMER